MNLPCEEGCPVSDTAKKNKHVREIVLGRPGSVVVLAADARDAEGEPAVVKLFFENASYSASPVAASSIYQELPSKLSLFWNLGLLIHTYSA